jgi:gliding motility-associated-like protein
LVTADSAQIVTDGSTPLSLGLGTNTATFNLSPGTYNFTLTYYNGCTLPSTQTINNGPTPGFTYTVVDDTCGYGGSITLTDTTTVLSGTNQYSIDNGTNYLSNNSFTNISANTYNAIMTITTNGQLCSSDTLSIDVNAIDLAANGNMNFTYDDFCASSGTSITTPPSYSNGTFSISPTLTGFNTANADISGATAGQTYTITYTYGTCFTTNNVTALNVADASFSYDNILNTTDSLCTGEQSTPNTITTTGGTFSLPTITSDITIDVSNGQILSYVPGTYQIIYNTGGGCPGEDTVSVTILSLPPQPNISTADSIICFDETVQQIIENSGITVDWFKDAPLGTTVGTGSFYQPIDANLQFGVNTFYAYYIDANGCASPYDSINIIKVDGSQLNVAEDSIGICLGSEVELTANENAISYVWAIDKSTDQSIIVSPTTETTYFVNMTDQFGCSITDSIDVYFLPASECHIETYTAFSPNGDNVNDTWIIDGIEGFNENIVYIYNRWGDLINKIENYDNSTNVWDGTTKFAKKAAPGTYFYIVEANGTKALSGWVQIVK